jgi:hypothetical protein
MDPLKLQAVVEKNANELQGVYGVFDPTRIPQLTLSDI